MNKQSDKANSNNKAKSFSDSGKEKSPIKKKKNKSQRYLASRLSLYPQLMLILPSFSFSKTLTLEEFADEKNSNIESDTLEESNPHHNESLITFLDPIAENKMSNIQPIHDDTNERTPVITPSARSSSHLASHAITPIGILPTPVQNHTINQAPAMFVTPPTTLNTPPPQHSQQQAVISGKDSATTTEDVTTHVSGKLTIIDFDRGEAHFSNTDIIGTLGTLHLTDNGAWTYDLDNTNPTVQALGKGSTATDSITVHSADGTPHQITITVNGTNDYAVISGSNTGAVTEESQLHTSGTLTVTDVDTGEAHFSNTNIAGTLGTLHLTDNGNWTYDLDNTNPAVQALGKGAAATDSITVHSADGTPHQITITVNGTNDKAVIGGSNTGAVTEESQLHTYGTLTVTDVDTGEAHFSNSNIIGTLGTLHLTDNGNWTYDLDNTNPTVQALGKGSTATDSITAHSADGTPHQITITVNGTNDKAVIGDSNTGTVTEESQLQTSGTLTVTDVDTGEAHFSSTDIIGSLGTLHLTDSGAWTYDLDNTNPAVQALGKGATATDSITVHSADGTPHQITITVNGTNDKAVIGGSNTGAVTEETQLHTSGTLTVTDVDTGEAHFSSTDIIGTLGTLHLTDNGAWTYDLDNTNSAVQALGKGTTATDSITVHSADGTPHQVTITVNGTNDKAVIGGSNTGAVTEESQLQTSGTLTVTDVDTGEAHFATSSTGSTDIAGTFGTLHLTDNGSWTYDLDNTNPAVQALGKGTTATDTITVHSADGTPHQVTITVNGTNDTAVIGGSNTGAVTEETQLNTSGTLTVTDVDIGEAHFSNTNIAGTLGTLHLTDNGNWTYDLDNTNPAVQALGKGATATDTITVHSADGTPHQVTITVNCTNDKAVIGGSNTGAVTEETQLQTSGTLTVTDVDTGEAHFSNIDITGSLGTLHLTDKGAWTYNLDNNNPAVQALGKGSTATDSITVHSADGTPHQVTITVNGTNDKAVIGGSNTGAVTEESQLQTSGTLTVTDVDTGEAHFSNTDIIGTLGTLHLTDNGSWTYDLDNSNSTVQALGQGQQVKDIITVQSADGTPHQISIVINGQNDAAVITGTTTGAVTEDRINGMQWLLTGGKMHISDSDSGEAKFDPVIHAHNYAGIGYTSALGAEVIVTPDGDWHYQLDNNITQVQSLGQGQSYIDKVTVHTVDGTMQELQVTITGTNDAPTVTGSRVLPAGTEDQTLHITQAQLLAGTNDIDKNDAGTLHVDAVTADHGTVTNNPDGSFTFHPDKDYNGQVHFTYNVKDAHGGSAQATASTTLAATSDSAIISEVSTDHVTEDGSHSRYNAGVTTELANGRLQVVDPDSGENKFQYSQFGESAVHDPFGGMLRIDSMGNWGYSVNNTNLQHLAQGQTETVVYRVHSYDGTAYELHIDVVGTNDAPTVTQVALSNGTEDTHYQMQASQFGFTDVDSGDTLHSIAITDLPPATQGKFVLDGHDITAGQHIPTADISKLQFVPAQDFNGDVQFKYTVNDGHTDSTEATNTLHFDAVGDVAVITGTTTGDVDEGHGSFGDMSPDYAQPGMAKLGQSALTVDGKLDIVDPDTGESQFDAKGGAWNNSYHGQYGHLLLNSDGTWHYDVTVGSIDWVGNRKTTVGTTIDELGENQTLTDTITVYSKDGTAHDIVITIHGDNDRPYISSEVTLATGTEDTAQTLTTADLLTNTVDVDANDAGKLTIENLVSDHGSLLDNKDGTFTFTPEKDYNGIVHFSYDVKDAHGGVTHTGATTTLAAVNDNPDTQPVIDSITEDTDTHHAVNLLSGATDVDGDSLSISQVQITFEGKIGPLPKGVSFANDGHTLVIDSHNPTFQHLSAGQNSDIVVHYMVDDNHGGQTAAIATITMVGTDDKATLASNVIQMTETQAIDSQHHMFRGTLQLIDPDSGDNTHFEYSGTYLGKGFPPGDLTVHPDGSYQFILQSANNRYADDHIASLQTGESMQIPYEIKTSDGQSLTIMVKVIGEDNQARIEVAPGSSFTEHAFEDRTSVSTPNQIWSGGNLHVIDPDHDQAGFIAQNIATSEGGNFYINPRGNWAYTIDNAKVQHLGQGESYQKTFSVESIDGSAHQDITITVHGTNDAPVVSTEIRIASGIEDTSMQLSTVELLANATDVDHNDIGQLSIANLVADHGVIIDNKDGTFSFSPEKDYNGQVHFSYDVKDAHGGVTHTGATTTLSAVQDNAVITGQDSGDVKEDVNVGPVVAGNANMIETHGQMQISDPDAGENHFHVKNYGFINDAGHPELHPIISSLGGYLSIGSDGTWFYRIDTRKSVIQNLGEGESTTDTVTVTSIDGTSHIVTVTIHGTNDAPYCSSEVQLSSGTEDTDIILTSAQLLANASDIDANDLGLLSVANLSADHGHIVDNHDGTFSFTPAKDYNGQVHFNYDVKDAHGGVTHTGATTTLAKVNDNPDNLPLVDSVTEDTDTHYSVNLLANATDIDGDSLTISQLHTSFEGSTAALPQGITLASDGHSLIIDSHAQIFQHLSAGEKSDIVVHYMVDDNHGGQTTSVATITVVGADDKAQLTSSIIDMTESQALHTYYQMGSKVGGTLTLTDPDTNDHTQFSFSGDNGTQDYGSLTIWPNGRYEYDLDLARNHHANDRVASLKAGETLTDQYQIRTSDGQIKLITVTIHGENDNARIEVTMPQALPAHQNVTEEHFVPASPTHLYAGGRLRVIDPDHGDAQLQTENITTTHHGEFTIRASGGWSYTIDNAIDEVQHLGAGESFTETHTVHSKDGTASQLLTVTVHGTNDAPVVSAEVRLVPSTEDTDIQLTKVDLLSQATDIDHNDIGQLNIANLVADHGTVVDNKDGTFTFHPQKDYNGQVHFNYDVIDAHGGLAHTGASTTLTATNDAGLIIGDKSGSITEDLHVQGDAQHTLYTTGILNVIDPDVGENYFHENHNVHAVNDQFGGSLTIGKAGDWAYSVPNANVQHLAQGQTETVQYEVLTQGGDKQIITVAITGTNDAPTVSEKPQSGYTLGQHHVTEDSGMLPVGQLVINDIDGDTTTVVIDPSHSASFGHVQYDSHTGAWVYKVDNTNTHVNALNDGDTLQDKFSLLVDDGHGGKVSQEIIMTIDGHTDTPPIPTLVTPATISGGAGHQDLHALLGIPPTLQQGTPNLQTGWGISDSHGHSVNTLHGQFGTLHINPATGELHYDYAPSSGVIKTHSGGNSGGTDETDTFVLTLGGSQNSHVEVHLHLHSQSVHGNSGHHIDQTTLTGMDISPILPTHPAPSPAVQHDEPDFSNNPISELSFSVDLDEHSSGASAYLDALGITPPPKLTEHNDHHAPTDLDIVLAHDNTAIIDDHSSHIDLSDAMDHHNQDHSHNKQEDENHHHHNDIDGLPDIDPNT